MNRLKVAVGLALVLFAAVVLSYVGWAMVFAEPILWMSVGMLFTIAGFGATMAALGFRD